jgi:hypothetical protein
MNRMNLMNRVREPQSLRAMALSDTFASGRRPPSADIAALAGLPFAAAALSRTIQVTAEELRQHRGLLCDTWGFRPIGVVQSEGSRRWLLARPGIERPLGAAVPGARRLVLVFDINGVLGAKWFDPTHRWVPPVRCHARLGNVAFFARPGVAKLLRMCDAAGHEVWLWSTMQRGTVDAFVTAIAPWLPPGRVLAAEDCPSPDTKDLARVWKSSAIAGADASQRTLLFDDDLNKGRLHPQCVVQVESFCPEGPFDFAIVEDRGALAMLARVAMAAYANS